MIERLEKVAPAESRRPVSVLCLITALIGGGAEMMLYRLMSNLDRTKFRPQVISMMELGPVAEKIAGLGVPVRSLGMQQGKANPFALFRLVRWLKHDRPDVMQTWMYHADLLGGLAARLVGNIPVSWNIRHSTLSATESKRLTHATARLCARLSHRLPKKIVCCSESARAVHTSLGYAEDKMLVIPNGYDLDTFKPDPAARRSMRTTLGIPQEAPVIGMIARFDPQKDHRNFLTAAGILHREMPDAHFVLCGEEITPENAHLMKWMKESGLQGRCHLLGRRTDIPQVNSTFDIASLSSAFGEAFPNVVAEAMSCGIPCVVTDVGDAARIVGDTGSVVPPRDSAKLANAWHHMLQLTRDEWRRRGLAARQRVMNQYSLTQIVPRYEHLFDELAMEHAIRQRPSSWRAYVRH